LRNKTEIYDLTMLLALSRDFDGSEKQKDPNPAGSEGRYVDVGRRM